MSKVTLYGIKNCDTVKKARKWLESEAISYQFHDLREDGIDRASIQHWCDALGWEAVLNKRSTTWKQLDEQQKNSLDESSAIDLLLEHPTLIKRPVLNTGTSIHNGFKAEHYATIFSR